MIPFPLNRVNRLLLARAFAEVPRVDISIDCVIEDQMGSAFVDSLSAPRAFMLELDRFFCYFSGDLSGEAGRAFLAAVPAGRMLMAGSDGWQPAVESCFGSRLISLTRYRYDSRALSLNHLHGLAAANPHTPHIQCVTPAHAGTNSPYLSISAFDSAEDFVARGIGYCLEHDGVITGAAYASLVCSDAIEVSIVVDPAHQRKGIATALACALLQWCLENHLAPHWDAANDESCRLAEKLGYTPDGTYTAYYLPE